MKFDAYWISPLGKILEVELTHIQSIIINPEYFSLSIGFIKEIYNRYNERLGLEGKAREEIIITNFEELRKL